MIQASRASAPGPNSGASLSFEEGLDHQLSTITAEGGGDLLERSMGALLRLVREQLQLEAVFVGELLEDRRVFRYVDTVHAPPLIGPGQSHPLEHSLCQRILDGRMPGLVGNVSAVRVAHGLPPIYDAVGAHVGVPVRFSDGRLYGMLCGFCLKPRDDLDERDIMRLEVAARAAARLLAQADGVAPAV